MSCSNVLVAVCAVNLSDALFGLVVVAALLVAVWLIAPARPWRRRTELEPPAEDTHASEDDTVQLDQVTEEIPPVQWPVDDPEEPEIMSDDEAAAIVRRLVAAPTPDHDLALIEHHFAKWTRYVWGPRARPDAVAFVRQFNGCHWVFVTATDKEYVWAYMTAAYTSDPMDPAYVLWFSVGTVPDVFRALEELSSEEMLGRNEVMAFPHALRPPNTRPLIIRPERR